MDLDYFKDINDTYGHFAGDFVLTSFAALSSEKLREYDVLARFGGEEFAVLLPEKGGEEAAQIAERLRQAASHAAISFEGQLITMQFRAGIATLHTDDDDLESVLRRADKALYQAKQAGRNRICGPE